MDFLKFSSIEKGVNDEGKKVYTFIASTLDIDRDRDIMNVKGIDYSNFMKNPVILFAHDMWDEPVGKAIDIKVEDDKLFVDIQFADTDKGKNIEKLVDGGYLNAVSVRFIPNEIYGICGEKSVDYLEKDYPDLFVKIKDKIKDAYNVITKSELLEVSVVPIPANQNALLVMKSKGIKQFGMFFNEEKKTVVKYFDLDDILEKGVVKKHPSNVELDTESSWEGSVAEESLRKWASEDGSGDKDKIDWVKYRQGFTWYDENNIDNFGSYKYPHHFVNDGKFYTVWRGVVSAMAYFMANKDNLPENDVEGVYNHLVKHYKEFDKEAPELKSYSIKDLIKIEDELFVSEYIKAKGISFLLKELNTLIDGYEKKLSENENKIKELEDTVLKKDSIIEDLNIEIKNLSSPSEKKEVDLEDKSDLLMEESKNEVKNSVVLDIEEIFLNFLKNNKK